MFRYAIDAINNQQADADGAAAADGDAPPGVRLRLRAQPVELPFGDEFLASKRLCRMLRTGLSAVFGPTTASSAQHAQNVCDAKELPYVDFRGDAETRPPVVSMWPHPDALAPAFVELVRAWQWTSFTVLYETGPFLPAVAPLLELYDPKEYTITVRRFETGLAENNYRSVLRRVRLAEDVHILLVCSVDVLPEVLKQAQQVRAGTIIIVAVRGSMIRTQRAFTMFDWL